MTKMRAIDELTAALNAIASAVDLPLNLAADLMKAVDACAVERATKAVATERARIREAARALVLEVLMPGDDGCVLPMVHWPRLAELLEETP